MDPATVEFVQRALALKDQARRGWFRAGVERPESVADHTWGVMLLSLVAAQQRPELDGARLLELALVHDLAEAVTGDLVPGEYSDKGEKVAKERAALEEMLGHADLRLRGLILARFEELASDASPEARFLHELDKLEMAFQAERYERQGVPKEKLADFRESARRGVQDGRLKDSLERVIRS